MLIFLFKKMDFILGKKLEMTQIFDEEGNAIPVTLIKVDPCVVVQVKTEDKDGYNAVQIGTGTKKRLNKAMKGHLKGLGEFAVLKEFRVSNSEGINVGDKIDLSVFSEGDKILLWGTSRGKGFQGVVKRYGFAGGPASHGQKHNLRTPGSIGALGPQKVFKGKKMPGRTGNKRVFVKGLKIVKVDKDNNILAVSGAVPGKKGSLVEIKKYA